MNFQTGCDARRGQGLQRIDQTITDELRVSVFSAVSLGLTKMLIQMKKSGGGRQDRTADLRVMNPSL